MAAHLIEQTTALRALAAACGDRLGATRVVPGEGNGKAQLALVGEAPGAEEDKLLRPFVGRSGRLIDELLLEAGLTREALWITNIVKVRPTDGTGDRLRNRTPRPDEIQAWLPCLEQELKQLAPQVIVALGATAAKALLGPGFRITKQRGVCYKEPNTGIDLLVTWHPAYVLRQGGAAYTARRQEMLADLLKAASRLPPKAF